MEPDGPSELCSPLTTLEELLNWVPDPNLSWPKRTVNKIPVTSFKVRGYGNKCHAAPNTFSPPTRIISRTAPKTILCHDYKGGYLDDRFANGSKNAFGYSFFHWAGIDIFIYFSHYFVTIPPLGWINSAHRNGVSVLGTLITEHIDGEVILKTILGNKLILKKAVDQLVSICKYFNFDGYLLNFENNIEPEMNIEILVFLKSLRVKLAQECGPDKYVIWYDSISFYTGKLQWQNRLNDVNKRFFDACDGIFVNYGWKPEELAVTAAAAGSRQLDVYVGVDVFGRGCYGGGGFNVDQALEKIRFAGLSVAIFAPAWTYECSPNSSLAFWRELFFWHKIWNYLYVHGPASLPFHSSFCHGRGTTARFNGRVMSDEPWFNLAEQDIQVSVPYCITDYDSDDLQNYSARCLRKFEKDAFRGGSCVMVSRPSGLLATQHCYVRLFACELTADNLFVTLVTKSIDNISSLSLVLLLEDQFTGSLKRHICSPDTAFKVLSGQSEGVPHIRNLFVDPNIRITRTTRPAKLFEDWLSHYFDLAVSGYTVIEIGVLHLGVCAVLLGNISLVECEPLTN